MKQITETEKTKFVPNDVGNLILKIFEFHEQCRFLSREIAVPRKQPLTDGALCQVYPNKPLHTMKNMFIWLIVKKRKLMKIRIVTKFTKRLSQEEVLSLICHVIMGL